MSDWLLLKCPNCGNLFRVSMDSAEDSAECTMCHQLVHFEASDLDAGEQPDKPAPVKAETIKVKDDVELAADELSLEESESSDPDEELDEIDEAILPKPSKTSYDDESEKAAATAEGSPVVVSSGAGDSSQSGQSGQSEGQSSQGKESKFRKMDESQRATSSRRHGSRSSRRRKVRGKGSKFDDLGWESDRRQRRRSDRVTVFFISGIVALMIMVMVFLLTRGQGGSAETSDFERKQQEEMLSQQAAAMEDFLGDDGADADDTPKWQKDFNKSPDRFLKKLEPIMVGFLEAGNWEDRLRFCANPESVRPLMEEYYKENEDAPIDYRDIFYGSSVSVGKFFISAQLLMDDYSKRGFVMLREDDGSWSVDWESFVGYSSMSMEKFQEVRPTEPQLFRLIVERPRTGYFNYMFSDEEAWECFVLTGNRGKDILYAYSKKFSDVSSKLNLILSTGAEAAITLEIRFPEDAPSANQVEIVKVIGEGWVPTIMRKNDAGDR